MCFRIVKNNIAYIVFIFPCLVYVNQYITTLKCFCLSLKIFRANMFWLNGIGWYWMHGSIIFPFTTHKEKKIFSLKQEINSKWDAWIKYLYEMWNVVCLQKHHSILAKAGLECVNICIWKKTEKHPARGRITSLTLLILQMCFLQHISPWHYFNSSLKTL